MNLKRTWNSVVITNYLSGQDQPLDFVGTIYNHCQLSVVR